MNNFKQIIFSITLLAAGSSIPLSCMNIFQAAEKGDLVAVQALIDVLPADQRPFYVMQQDMFDLTPLHLAASNGHTDVIQALLAVVPESQRSPYANLQDTCGHIPLHFAAINGHVNAVHALLAAVPESQRSTYVMQQDEEGATPLYAATNKGKVAVIQALIAAVTEPQRPNYVNQRGKSGYTPLHIAAMRGNGDEVQILIAAGANLDLPDAKGKKPAEIASVCKHPKIATLINDYKIARQITRSQAEVMARAWHPRIGIGSPAAILTQDQLQSIMSLVRQASEPIAESQDREPQKVQKSSAHRCLIC